MDTEIHRRPSGSVADEILSIVRDLTGEWFTPDVEPATRRDLLFQDVICVRQNGRIRAFLMFTSHDGAIHITLMGTSPEYRRRGFGTALIERLMSHAEELGFGEIVTFTVPPAAKAAYQATVDFYKKRGFRVVREHTTLWQSGALELRRSSSSNPGCR
jgi:ribosomal protein S18 acetylase RimI-like enzyme